MQYPGHADTRTQTVRLRAADGMARRTVQHPVIRDGRIVARGTISSRARGVVRLQLEYETARCELRVLAHATGVATAARSPWMNVVSPAASMQ